jgi:hypothetical protein
MIRRKRLILAGENSSISWGLPAAHDRTEARCDAIPCTIEDSGGEKTMARERDLPSYGMIGRHGGVKMGAVCTGRLSLFEGRTRGPRCWLPDQEGLCHLCCP